MDDTIPMDALEDGGTARIEGTIRLAGEPLRSPLLGRSCAYWDVRRGLGHEPERRESSTFWIDHGAGRVLIRTAALDVDVRAKRTEEVLATVSADHQVLSEKLRELKERRKRAAGDEAKRLAAERERLAKVATYLLAVRAHARGKLHLGGRTLAQQARWIEENAPKEGDGAATVRMTVDRYEVVLADGDTVVAEGVVTVEPIPASLAGGGGYREQPVARVLGPGPSGVVRITGVSASQPQAPPPVTRAGATTPGARFERGVVATVAFVAAVAGALWWWLR